jgi:hypothetical protein
MEWKRAAGMVPVLLLLLAARTGAQQGPGPNDTIRLGAMTEHGVTYPAILLPEYETVGLILNAQERIRRDRLRNNIMVTYPYAITAAAILKDVQTNLDTMDRRRDRKKYLKFVDHQLDAAFKAPLKNLSIDQGHILIKLITRQTGQDCYSIIREMKGGINAMMWQGVGLFFNNNLRRDYDPEDGDREMEGMVRELEASSMYRYQLYQQQALMKQVTSNK